MAEPTQQADELQSVPPTIEEHNEAGFEALADPELQSLFGEAFPDEDGAAQSNMKSTLSGPNEVSQSQFLQEQQSGWDALAESQKAEFESDAAVGTAAVKGVLKAGANVLDFATERAVDVSRYTGLYKVGRDDEEEQNFLKWYEESSGTRAPATIDGTDVRLTGLDRAVDETMGPTRGGLPQFIEGATQFTVGMVGASRMLANGAGGFGMGLARGSGALETGAAALGSMGRVGKYAASTLGATLKGAIADGVFFNPWEKKLADMIEDGPTFLSNPVTRYLQADKDDSDAEARFKRALEGAMLGTAIDGFVGVLKVMKARLAFKTGALKKDEAEVLMEAAGDALENGGTGSADDFVKVVETEDGRFAVEGADAAGFKVSPILEPKPASRLAAPVEAEKTASLKPGQAVEEKTVALTPDQVKQEQDVADVLGPELKAPVEKPVSIAQVQRTLKIGYDKAKKMVEDAKAAGKPLTASTMPQPAPAAVQSAQTAKRMVFSNQADAQAVAATMNFAGKNRILPRGKLTDESLAAWNRVRESYDNGATDMRQMGQLLDDYGFNINYAQQPSEVLNVIKAMVDVTHGEKAAVTRRSRTHEEMLNAAADLLPGVTGDDALVMAERVFGSTNRLAEELLALRAVMWGQASAVKRLSQQAHASANNSVAVDQLAAALDSLMDLHALVTGAKSNTARALNVGGISQGQLVDKLGDMSVPVVRAEGQGAAEATVAGGKGTPTKAPSAPAKPPEAAAGAPGAPEAPAAPGAGEATVAGTPSAKAAQTSPVLVPPPTPKPGAMGQNIMGTAENAAADVPDKAMSEILKEWQQANPGVVLPTGHNAFTTRAGLKQEVAAWKKLVKDIESRPDRAANQMALTEASAKLNEVNGMLKKLDKQVKIPKHLAPLGRRATEGLTPDQIKSLMRNVLMADGDPGAILWALRGAQVQKAANRTADRTMARKMFDWAMTFRINGMLSAPTTHATNVTSNMQTMLMRPMEYWWAGIAPTKETGKWTWSQHPELRQEGADMLMGIFAGWKDSWTATSKAFMMGKNILDPATTVNDGSRGITSWADSTWLQKIVHLPERALMSSDEMFKQLNYRASMRAQILRLARENGVTDPTEIARRLVMDVQMSFGPNGAVNPRALEYARTNTFTNPLEYGWGKSLQEFASKHPTFRIIMPFIRTPTNIFRYVWQRTPLLGQFQEQMVKDLAAGGERAALARAKTAMGVAIWGTGAALVASGRITGRGPSDPDMKRQMEDANWKPYSIRIGDRYVSYRKGDPVATSLGMIADLVQISGELSEKDQKFYLSAAMSAIISNLSSKSYMQGLVDAMDGISSNDANKLNTFVANTAGSFIPAILRRADPMVNLNGNNGRIAGNEPGTWFEDSGSVLDGDSSASPVREARGFIDGLMNRIPGFSGTLEARRNILGEKVMRPPGYLSQMFNPFTVSGKVDDESVQSELIRVGKAFSMPAPVKFNGMLDLTDRDAFNVEPNGTNHGGQSPYNRMLEIMAKPPNNAPSLKEALHKLVKSDQWKAIPGDDAYGKGGLKHELAQKVISAYQEMAFGQVLSEYSVLQTAYLQAIEVDAVGRAKGVEGVRSVMEKYEGVFGTNKSPVQPRINWRDN